MPAQLDRTSTHIVLDTYLTTQITDPIELTEKVNERGYSRRASDVKRMLKHLEEIGLVKNKHGEFLVKLLKQVQAKGLRDEEEIIGGQLLSYLTEKGLAVLPFLEAVRDHPNDNSMIQVKTVIYGKRYGYYHLRDGDDVSAAMKNLMIYLGFMRATKTTASSSKNKTTRKTSRGVYELTDLGKRLIEQPETSKLILQTRVKCGAGVTGEPCREVCPTNAIIGSRITSQCIECGLCTITCPYGAITINCGIPGGYELNTEICKSHAGKNRALEPCDANLISADEHNLQRWLKALLNLSDVPAEIPSSTGEYPDIVTAKTTTPSFVEVKKKRLTKQLVEHLLTNQLPRYMKPSIIKKTLNRLKEFKKFHAREPEIYVVITKESKFVESLLKEAKKLQDSTLPKPVTFMSYDVLYEYSKYFSQSQKKILATVWQNLQPWKDASQRIKSILKTTKK